MEINNNVRVIGSTHNQGIVLLIKAKDIDNSGCKCVSVQKNGEVKEFDSIETPLTFNSFEQVDQAQSDLIIATLNRRLTNDKIEKINELI